ncbi:SRPBCC family protein [Streptomyces sp. NPDC015242]|uniref:SRPBCC family protein n=1 Tax=Streptomyces sp. NPDC015242 TaxID=3364951 RepID=UPI0037020BA2
MEHEVFVPVPAERLREVLDDPARVARAVPGLQQDAGAEPVAGRLKIRVGGHSVTYRGAVRVARRDGGAYGVEGSAQESRGSGSVTLALRIALREAEDGCTLVFGGTATADGRIKDLPADAVEGAVTRLLNRFAEQLAQTAPGTGTPAAPQDSGPRPTTDPEARTGEQSEAPAPDPEAPTGARGEAPAPEPGEETSGPVNGGETPAPGPGPADGTSGPADGSSGPGPEEQPGPAPGPAQQPGPGPAQEPGPGPAQEPGPAREPGPGPAQEPGPRSGGGVPPSPLGPLDEDGEDDDVAEAAHARRTMIGRSAEEVDHAPPRGRYAPVPAPQTVTPPAPLRWAAPAAALAVASAIVAVRALRRRR